jgi:serine/threonine protein kinase
VFDFAVPIDRLRIVCASFNFYRVLVSLSRMVPAAVPRLYKPIQRDDSVITIMDDHVSKECNLAPGSVYDCLHGDDRIPFSVDVVIMKSNHLKITPVCSDALPASLHELKRAVRSVLTALVAFHGRGFLHRDVRWPNILCERSGDWLLADFELADYIGEPLPEKYLRANHFAPEVMIKGAPCTPASDVWQVGKLVAFWLHENHVADDDSSAFALVLSADSSLERPTCEAALQHAWLGAS